VDKYLSQLGLDSPDDTPPSFTAPLIVRQYVVMAKQARAIGRRHPEKMGNALSLARMYMREARKEYDDALIKRIYAENK
jgi:hypothetical protein